MVRGEAGQMCLMTSPRPRRYDHFPPARTGDASLGLVGLHAASVVGVERSEKTDGAISWPERSSRPFQS